MTNLKARLVFCPSCRAERETAESAPSCGACARPMLTVVYSSLDGRRLTGTPMPVTYGGMTPRRSNG